jgi:hypothetical protein
MHGYHILGMSEEKEEKASSVVFGHSRKILSKERKLSTN